MSRRNSQILILLILLAAAFLRLRGLAELPPGLNFDEAGNGVAALDILGGEPRLWWRIGGGKEPLWPYIIALSTAGLGRIPLAVRFPAAVTGILTVAAAYRLMLALFPRRPLIPLLTALGLALSGWHLHFSRLGFRAILLPLLATLAFYFLYRRRQLWAAFFMALAIYSYLAARLLPLIPLLWFISLSVPKFRTDSIPRRRGGEGLRFFGGLLLFLLPLIGYFILNPADLMARTATVSIFHQPHIINTLGRTLTRTLGTFFGLAGDANPLVNLPGQPALSPLLAPFFGLGLLLTLYSLLPHSLLLHPPTPLLPHFSTPSPPPLLLAWWAVMLLPAILAPEGAPHHLRLIGAIVPTYGLVAIGLAAVAHSLQRVGWLLPVLVYAVVGYQSYDGYFIRWPEQVDFTLPVDLYAVRLAGQIRQTPATEHYILPMDIRAGTEARHYTLDYLLGGRGYTYLPVDEVNAERILTRLAARYDTWYVVRWQADKHRAADEKEIVAYLLETNARFRGRESFPVYDIETYEKKPGPEPEFQLPEIETPIGAVFADRLRLDAAFVPDTATPGEMLPLAITLAPLAPMETNYKASIRLTAPNGERVVQKDRPLRHNFHQGTALWPPETVNEYYLLPLPPGLEAGRYTVTLVIYQPETLTPLIANGLAELPLGTVRLE